MTNIKIKRIILSYFKGIKHLEISFNDGVTSIYGDNGTGKTTIVDAFLWVLFNKNSQGQTKFRIRTTDADGNYINNVENSVEITLSVNGVERTIKKQLIVKADYGTSNKEQSSASKFFIDGQVATKGDFDEYISSIISEDTFRTITSPTYFFSLDWKKQRNLLTSLIDEPTSQEINSTHEFDLVEEALKSQLYRSIDDYAKHIKYQRDEVQKSLDIIPAQIEENRMAMPEECDYDEIENKLSKVNDLFTIEKKYYDSLSSNKDEAKINHTQKQIEFQQKRISTISESSYRMAMEQQNEYNEQLLQLRNKLTECKQNVDDLGVKMKGLNACISQTNLTVKEQQSEQAHIREEWQKKVNCKFVEPDFSDAVCPSCGQPLPMDKVNELRTQALAVFNERKAEAKKILTERANVSKNLLARAEADLKSYAEQLTSISAKQKACADYIPHYEKDIVELKKNPPKTAQELMSINVGYQDAMRKIEELKVQLDAPSEEIPSAELERSQNTIMELEAKRTALQHKLAEKNIFLSHKKRIEELETKQSQLLAQLDNLLKQSNQCHDYQLRTNSIIESRINELFHYVQFTLFRNLVNGTTEPSCEGLVDNVPISTNVNTASRINAGRDICNVFADKVQVFAPIFSDNAESVNELIPVHSQDIRLYVSRDRNIRVE